MRRKLKIYIETSVISHLDAPDRPDRMGETLLFWKEVTAKKYEIVIFLLSRLQLYLRRIVMNSFGIKEIHAIRAQWAEMPREEFKAEQKKLFESAMRRMYGENWRAKVRIIN